MDTNDWIIRIGKDDKNFKNLIRYKRWIMASSHSNQVNFFRNVKTGDRLWFILSKQDGDIQHGKIMGVSTYVGHNHRHTGILINLTPDDDELGISGSKSDTWDTEVHWDNFIDMSRCDEYINIQFPGGIVRYIHGRGNKNLPDMYHQLLRFRHAF